MNTQFFMGWLRTTWLAGLLIAGTTGRGLAAIPDDLLIFHSEPQAFPLTPPQQTASVVVDPADWPGVVRVAGDLVQDIHRVSDHKTELVISRQPQGEQLIVVGTLGKSALIDALVQTGKLSASELTNRWEAYTIATLVAPWPGVKQALVIAGSDKRGTIYGVYELSSQMGVSPWYYWADVLPQAHPVIYCRPGSYHQGEPSVKYRGIFLNDEAPDLTGWVREKFGEVPGHPGVANYGPGFYTNLFEVILRCQGNFLWPAMWNNAFNEDDTNNPALADRYGIVMGTSHQEPMLRAQKEWDRRLGRTYGNWNYNLTNQQPVLQQFWREGVRRNKPYESIVTLGLRAENDAGTPIG
ncbi:MAG TPA: glycosyl hydrolase 115 family protein, partial [Verrucomicrobiae bacterium]